jgi:hypothetical protein
LKIKKSPSALSVIIPARDESNGIDFLRSLMDNTLDISVNIYVVINASENDPIQIKLNNQSLYNQLTEFVNKIPPNYFLHIILENNLNHKDAGVGLARKIGMDKAAKHHFEKNEFGILVCYDADCWAPKGFLKAIFDDFRARQLELASIKYQHQIIDKTHPIVDYELFLRYYSEALRQANYPFWFQTVGSSMAVLSSLYLKHGGMNKRKAGEDFSFMHKMMPVSNTGQINSTCNELSARTSERVPFGTGKAMIEANNARIDIYYSYQPKIFNELKIFLDDFDKVTQLDNVMQCRTSLASNKVVLHFNCNDYWEEIEKIKNNCKSMDQFKPRFFQFFNGFKVLKYVHWARDVFYTNIPLNDAVTEFIQNKSTDLDNYQLLLMFRDFEK